MPRKWSEQPGQCCMCKRTDQPVAIVPSFRGGEYDGALCALCIVENIGQCPNCSRMLKRGSLVCPSCKAPIPCNCSRYGWDKDWKCLHCGKPKSDSIQYCGVCKQPLEFKSEIDLGMHGVCEDRKIWGDDQYIYCGNHRRYHKTGQCSAGIDMKVGLGTKDKDKASLKCHLLGLEVI